MMSNDLDDLGVTPCFIANGFPFFAQETWYILVVGTSHPMDMGLGHVIYLFDKKHNVFFGKSQCSQATSKLPTF